MPDSDINAIQMLIRLLQDPELLKRSIQDQEMYMMHGYKNSRDLTEDDFRRIQDALDSSLSAYGDGNRSSPSARVEQDPFDVQARHMEMRTYNPRNGM